MEIPLSKSSRSEKKWMVVVEGRKIHFGSSKHLDYTLHKDPKRKAAYLVRHRKNEDWNNPRTPAFWATNLLWNQNSLEDSIRDTENRFNLIIKRS